MSTAGGFPEGWFSYSNNVQRLTAVIASQQKQAGKQFSLKSQLSIKITQTKHVRFEIWKRQNVSTRMRSRVSAFREGARRDWAWAARARHAPVGVHSQSNGGDRRAGLTHRLIHAITKSLWWPAACAGCLPGHHTELVSNHFNNLIVMHRKPYQLPVLAKTPVCGTA